MTRATLAVILARGLGTRMRAGQLALSAAQAAAADAGAKGAMPIAGRPFLDYVLHELAEAGVTDALLVVAPEHEALREALQRSAPQRRVRLHFAVQAEPRGTADAVASAVVGLRAMPAVPRDADGRIHFLMLNADNLYPQQAIRALMDAEGPALAAFEADALVRESGIEPERVNRFALLALSSDGWLEDIVEKPSAEHPLTRAPERWVSMNLWRFTDDVAEDCAAVQPSPRGELELADAVRHAISRGVKFRGVRLRAGVLDLTQRADITAVETRLRGREPQP